MKHEFIDTSKLLLSYWNDVPGTFGQIKAVVCMNSYNIKGQELIILMWSSSCTENYMTFTFQYEYECDPHLALSLYS